MQSTPEPETRSRLELKYCEGCGALCLRSAGEDAHLCAACRERFSQTATASVGGRS
jgi:hypothetical protein